MSRYTGPVCRLCRAEGAKLFLKGDRCYTEKCGLTKRNSKPGQHGTRRGKMSEYGLRLREKQKLRRFYGINETQFSTIYKKATGMSGQTGHNFLQLLERRLDNVVYRLGLGVSRSQARQLVCHGHFTVNGRKLDIPSALLKVGDVVAVAEGSRDVPTIKQNAEASASRSIPAWLEFNPEAMSGSLVAVPVREQIDVPVNEQLVVEFYAR
ncbi:30S ribosomal protein S4 [Cloacibacillus porcorum]|jgi:small subunit ribosomal protein S4|uniref:Small ribosomal subunit protein uS4 n=1 Tax=Cloacibacillus porcorum TaxID=1197717 RepID=A0A1B2I3M0_9BACT|nr:30S ribosomal protein S4 [Cloacibacillus porcorum]ANZ44542.1 30S ribosomal protein S4 [Cloacibacillus porcorum]MCC8184332.1 30S ribosomal protein S4 [Cloacibacillus porcorum]MCD7876608.1 30S ribosomal protein S4 [Cloacibacillus porcorum]MCI5864128.1 30S ribosomal protein S4 [Cloacibacillus porcorum]MDD7648125.1 30S ribosomal protein S4 [Cloacibacillus porcorum]